MLAQTNFSVNGFRGKPEPEERILSEYTKSTRIRVKNRQKFEKKHKGNGIVREKIGEVDLATGGKTCYNSQKSVYTKPIASGADAPAGKRDGI